MYQPPTRTDHALQAAHNATPPSVYARRRHLLGIVLLMAGTAWLTLRLTGQVGYIPMPICWFGGLAGVMHHFNLGCGDVSVSAIGYGMLVALSVHRA